MVQSSSNNNFFLTDAFNNGTSGGNKYRKLDYILKNKFHTGLLTFGSKYSSHCLAAAYYGFMLGIPVELIILEDSKISIQKYPHLKLASQLGAKLNFINTIEASEKIDWFKQKFFDYSWIPGGGHSQEGLKAYSDFFDGIIENNRNIFKKIRRVICPLGTGTTVLGILDGILKNELDINVVGVSVARPKEKCLDACYEFLGAGQLDSLIIDDKFAGQYGKIESSHLKYRLHYLKDFGLLPDPIYNVRVAQYIYDNKVENSLVFNTGGLANNFL